MEDLDIPDALRDYFNCEAYGRDVLIEGGGHLAPGGYIVQTSGDFKEFYHDTKDIPAEHRVFSCLLYTSHKSQNRAVYGKV